MPRYRRAKGRVTQLYQRIMEAHQRERHPDQPLDFVDELLEASQTDPQFLPDTDLFANVLAPYLVGMDTSASVCAFMLYALLKHPEILERMRAEVEEIRRFRYSRQNHTATDSVQPCDEICHT